MNCETKKKRKRHEIYYKGKIVTPHDFDVITVCTVRNAYCRGCCMIDEGDCDNVKYKFNVDVPADVEGINIYK